MPPKKKDVKKTKSSCLCGGNCHDEYSHLPGILLAVFGLLALMINFGMVPGLESARAWPLLPFLFGIVYVVRIEICRRS